MRRPPSVHDLEVFLPFPVPRDRVTPARHWRSTWLIASLQSLKARGHFTQYERLLPAGHASAILTCVAGVWLPNAVARAHYETCGMLGLPRQEQFEMGLTVGDRAQGTVLQTAVRVANEAGVDPWSIFARVQRLWERGADGGAAAVYKAGPKEAILEVVGDELFDVPYFRNAFGGVMQGIVRLFCVRAYVHDVTPRGTAGGIMLRFQWV